MVTKDKINADPVYYNFQGKMPPVPLEAEPAPSPHHRRRTEAHHRHDPPRRRAGLALPALPERGASALCRSACTSSTTARGRIDAIETFIYQRRDAVGARQAAGARLRVPADHDLDPRQPEGRQGASRGQPGPRQRDGDAGVIFRPPHLRQARLPQQGRGDREVPEADPRGLEYDITPRVHLEDTTRADIYGWVIPFIRTVLDATEGRAKFRVCDTIGWGVPDPYAVDAAGHPASDLDASPRDGRGAGVPRPQRLRPGDGEHDRGLALRLPARQHRLRRPRRAHRQHVAGADRRVVHPPLRRPRVQPFGARRRWLR